MRKKMHGKPYYPHLLCVSFYVILWVVLLLFGSNKPGKVNSYVFFFRYKSDNLLLLIHKQVLHFFYRRHEMEELHYCKIELWTWLHSPQNLGKPSCSNWQKINLENGEWTQNRTAKKEVCDLNAPTVIFWTTTAELHV